MIVLPTLIAQFGSFDPQSPLVDGAAEDPGANIEAIISNIVGFLTIIGAIFFIVYFLMAAMEWITSGGDSGKLTTARNKMMQGILGLVILVAAYGIIGLIGSIVGIELLEPALLLESITPGGGTP
ncbi:hypothetical protein KA017_03095 [Candidatus Woesebacteria bacterium]|nr:hypothetical protein [Candidatus Woesebacteria bacterium]